MRRSTYYFQGLFWVMKIFGVRRLGQALKARKGSFLKLSRFPKVKKDLKNEDIDKLYEVLLDGFD